MSSENLNIGPGADLRGAHLEGRDLRGVHLEEAQLNRAFLQGAHLEGAHLEGADLRGVHFEGADLRGVHLEGAHLERVNLKGAHLEGAYLEGIHLFWARLERAHLEGAHLEHAWLHEANFTGAILISANLTDAYLYSTNLTIANLSEANLTGANLTRANLTGADLSGANLTGINLTSADLSRANLTGANLTGADLSRANLTGANLTGANLTGANLTTANLTGADLSGANLTRADINGVDLNYTQREQIRVADVQRQQIAAPRFDRQGRNRNRSRSISSSFQQMPSDASRTIIIRRELHRPRNLGSGRRNNFSSNSCPDFKDLYDFIMRQDLNGIFRFKFEDIGVVDLAGLTRQVFDKILPVYVHLFFIERGIENFILLKEDVDMDVLNEQTMQLKKLAKAAHAQIILRINPEVIGLLSEKNPKESIALSENFNRLYSNLKDRIAEVSTWGENMSGYLVKNNGNQENISLENINELTREVKAEIILRKRLYDLGFTSWVQYSKMALLIKRFWNTSNGNKVCNGQVRLDLFATDIRFDIESFRERIKIIRSNGEVLDLSRIPKVLMEDYPGLKPLLDYILSESEDGNENRKIFSKYVAGTEYYPGELKIRLTNQRMSPELYNDLPFFGHSCDNRVDMFRVRANYRGEITQNVINAQLRATTSSFEGRE
jgi:uncharacterized protein YjbI with pentapeptide repeats